MSDDLDYTKDESILDLGNHREPDLEKVVEAKPDLIINGQRFAQFHDDLAKLAPEAVVLELDPRDDEDFGSELAPSDHGAWRGLRQTGRSEEDHR